MPRQRKSADIHRLQGTFQRVRHGSAAAAQPDRRMYRPRHLTKDQALAWNYLVDHAAGRLTHEDQPTLEAAAVLLARIRDAGADADTKDLSQYRMYLRDLKLTATTRPPPPEKRDDTWDF